MTAFIDHLVVMHHEPGQSAIPPGHTAEHVVRSAIVTVTEAEVKDCCSASSAALEETCEVLPKEYTPHWIAAHIGPYGHGGLLGDDAWYAVYWDYSDLPSDTWN